MSKFKAGDKVRAKVEWINDRCAYDNGTPCVVADTEPEYEHLMVLEDKLDGAVSCYCTRHNWTCRGGRSPDRFELVECAPEPETQEESETQEEQESVEEPEEEILNGPALSECQKCEEPLYRVKKHGWLGLIYWEWVHVQDRLVKLDCSNVKPEPKPGTVKQ